MHILAIDDDPIFLNSIARLLRPHDVTLAYGGREAITYLERTAYDAILCDLVMPGLRGIGIYEYLQRVHPGEEERIVFVTGFTPGVGLEAYLNAVPNEVLKKPFDGEELIAALSRVAGRSTAVRRSRPRVPKGDAQPAGR